MKEKEKKIDPKIKEQIYKQKVRCGMCFEITIINNVDISNDSSMTILVTAECLNKHGIYYCILPDFCNEKNQYAQIRCNFCNNVQGEVDYQSKLFGFCIQDHKFICPTCAVGHFRNYQKSHKIASLVGLDFLCKEHGINYNSFCKKCNINICETCHKKTHNKHEMIMYKSIYPDQQKLSSAMRKVQDQKIFVKNINKKLDPLLKVFRENATEFYNNLNSCVKLNERILNSLDEGKLNYQSIKNFDKIINIEITDISWTSEIKEYLEEFVKHICSISTKPIKLTKDKPTNQKNAKEDNTNKISNEEFKDNELLAKIGKKNNKVFTTDEIEGEIQELYTLKELNNYLIIADNGIFILDQKDNNLINYIDINEGFEYDEINSISYYYNKNTNKIYLFVSTNSNKIKIYIIDEKNQYTYELLQEIKFDKINSIFCNKNGDLLILEKDLYWLYQLKNNKYEKETFISAGTLKKILSTENNLIFVLDQEIEFYDEVGFKSLFKISNVNFDEHSKIFEINKNIICISFQNKIQIVDIEKKAIHGIYDKINMDYVECADLLNDKEILLSCNNKNKLTFYVLEWNNATKTLKENKKIEELECKKLKQINKNKVLLYTKYGINVVEI